MDASTRAASMMTKSLWTGLLPIACVVSALALAPQVANAQAPIIEAKAAPTPRSFALTFAPLLMHMEWEGHTARVLELTGEMRLTDQMSLALVLGAGKVTQKATLYSPEESAEIYDIGLQGRYYLVGDFRHGMQLGAELLFVADSQKDPAASVGFTQPGVFLGYKYTAQGGFTVDVQLGARRVRETLSDEDPEVRPLLNLNLGWSF